MSVKQISIFLENKGGRLANVTKVLGDNGINISALSIADTTDFGILRMILSDPEKAETVLKENGYAVSISPVLAIAIDDTSGSLSSVLQLIEKDGTGIEYIYAFIGKTDTRALVVLKVKDIEGVSKLLTDNGICVLKDEEVYRL